MNSTWRKKNKATIRPGRQGIKRVRQGGSSTSLARALAIGLDMRGSSITQGLEGEGGGTGREAPSDAADPSSELPFRPQQTFKNAPTQVPSFKPLQSRFVQCSSRGRLGWFYQCRRTVGASRRLEEKPSAAQIP